MITVGAAKAKSHLPAPVTTENFSALKEKSPFSRSLNKPSAMILTGVAQIKKESIVTLIDSESGDTILVSEKPNAKGWKLENLSSKEDLDSAVANITTGNGEVIRVVYDEEKRDKALKIRRTTIAKSMPSTTKVSEKKPDGEKGGQKKPPMSDAQKKGFSELSKRFGAMNKEQQAKAREIIKEAHTANPNMDHTQRLKTYNSAVDQATGRK